MNAATTINSRSSLRSACLAACMAGFLILSGCASFQITVPDSDPIKPKGHTEGYLKKTMHAYFWGWVLDPRILSAECEGQGINDVIIYRSLAHDLAGVVTLGLWMPTEVYYRCKAPPARLSVPPSPSKRSKSRQLS